MVSLIVFDLDGTLIDSRQDLAGAVNYMRSSMGLEPLQTERIVSFIGNGVVNLVRRSVADAEVDFETALKRMKRYYAEHLTDTTKLYDGVKDGIAKLKQSGFKLAVVSNKGTEASTIILQKLGVAEFLDDIIGGDADYPLKPEPDSLIALQQKYSADKNNCWILGDHYTDLEAGRRASFHCALARYGIGDPREEKAELEVDSFTDFVNAVCK
jgi:phosphoglycolate phosphatase